MRRHVAATILTVAMVLGGAATAQDLSGGPGTGKQAGDVLVRGRVLGVSPMDSASGTSIGGRVMTTNAAAPEIDLSYFFTDHFAVELMVTSSEHAIKAVDTRMGNVALGSTWILPPTLTLQYHFFPRERLSPYVGAGVNGSFFFTMSSNGQPVQNLSVDDSVGAAIQIGFDYNIVGRWFANFDFKQIFVDTTMHGDTTRGPLMARTALDPLMIGAGIGYRF